MDIENNATVRSWDGTWTYRPKVVAEPRSAQDIVEIMIDPAQYPSPVRPRGSMHSPARMNGDDAGTMIDMRAMNRILDIGKDTITVEPGVRHVDAVYALKERGMQLYVMTEIGDVTLGAMATAATKDSSFPGEFGQVSSYVKSVRLVTPAGEIKTYTEDDNPEEMRLIRTSYGLLGIVFEITIKVRPTTALYVRHVSLSNQEFRKNFAGYRAQGYAVMYYLFPFARKVVVELRKDNPAGPPTSNRPWSYRNRFWRKYGPIITQAIKGRIGSRSLRNFVDKLHFLALRRGLVLFVRGDRTWPHAQIICYPRDPGRNKYIFSMWAFDERSFFDTLDEYCDFCADYEKKTGYRCDLPGVGYAIAQDQGALLSYSWDFPTLSIDPAATGGKEWEDFLSAYNEFCSARAGLPLFNQTPFLTRDQVKKAFGKRLDDLAAARQEADPNDRLLDSHFRELLSDA